MGGLEVKKLKKESKIYQTLSKARGLINTDPTYKERNLTRRQKVAREKENFGIDHGICKSQSMMLLQDSSNIQRPVAPIVYSETSIPQKLEFAKQKLWLREDYNIFEIYKTYFDIDSNGHITPENFDHAMQTFGVEGSYKPLTKVCMIIKRIADEVQPVLPFDVTYLWRACWPCHQPYSCVHPVWFPEQQSVQKSKSRVKGICASETLKRNRIDATDGTFMLTCLLIQDQWVTLFSILLKP